MALLLSEQDQSRLQDTIQTLVSPLGYPHLDDWRRAVNYSAKQLLFADKASFLYPVAGKPSLLSGEFDPASAHRYPHHAPRIPRMVSIFERQLALVVWSRATVYDGYLDEYHRSEYYNEYIVPVRAYDSIGITLPLPDEANPSSIAGLMFHHDRLEASPFGGRGMALLHLLLPALRAGVTTYRRFEDSRESLGLTMDASGAALLICDRSGRELHRTPRLIELLHADPEADRLRAEMRDMAHTLGRLARRDGGAALILRAPATRELLTACARYRLYGSYLGTEKLGPGAAVMVTLECLTPALPSEGELRERFGLTCQGIRVARLLALGKSNAEIAEALCISPHTARHHVEQVMQKLAVRSRAEVRPKLQGAF